MANPIKILIHLVTLFILIGCGGAEFSAIEDGDPLKTPSTGQGGSPEEDAAPVAAGGDAGSGGSSTGSGGASGGDDAGTGGSDPASGGENSAGGSENAGGSPAAGGSEGSGGDSGSGSGSSAGGAPGSGGTASGGSPSTGGAQGSGGSGTSCPDYCNFGCRNPDSILCKAYEVPVDRIETYEVPEVTPADGNGFIFMWQDSHRQWALIPAGATWQQGLAKVPFDCSNFGSFMQGVIGGVVVDYHLASFEEWSTTFERNDMIMGGQPAWWSWFEGEKPWGYFQTSTSLPNGNLVGFLGNLSRISEIPETGSPFGLGGGERYLLCVK